MIDAKKIEIDGTEYVAVESKTGDCNGCALKERTPSCDRVKCTEYQITNGIQTAKFYKWKKNEQK